MEVYKITKEVIDTMKVKGFTYLGNVEGKDFFCNLRSEESIKQVLNALSEHTGEEWESLDESVFVGEDNSIVFFRKSMYKKVELDIFDYLVYNGDGHVELPLNCRCINGIFEECKLPDGFTLDDSFDTSEVFHFANMFRRAKLPEGFKINFDTSSATTIGSMFRDTTLPEGFSLGSNFASDKVWDFNMMFENCRFPNGFHLDLNTKSAKSMQAMFSRCEMNDDFYLGEDFVMPDDVYAFYMFHNCKLPEGKTEEDFKNEQEIVDWLKSRAKKVECSSAF